MLHAERESSRKLSRTFEWSLTLAKAIKSLHYWQLHLRYAQGYTFNRPKLSRLQQELCIDIQLQNAPISEIVQQLRTARKVLRDHQERHLELQEQHLQDLAEARLIAQDPSIALPRQHQKLINMIKKEIQ